jgi:hypothetical protein
MIGIQRVMLAGNDISLIGERQGGSGETYWKNQEVMSSWKNNLSNGKKRISKG